MAEKERNCQKIFDGAIEFESADERRVFLDRSCQGDDRLRAEVEVLIKAYQAAGSFLEKPIGCIEKKVLRVSGAAGPADCQAITKPPVNLVGSSSVIGPYKLLQQIGEGGMGTVWMAEQEHPVRRRVAVKLVRADLGSKEISARFEAERQALAMMDHPNIARVLDAGTTDNGNPYFVMELVNGLPVNEFCDQNKLTVRERLDLFVPICSALQHAHQKGIIHRDLKPSNVLVTLQDGKPLPKVIDFGLAKALEHTHKLTDKTLITEFGKVVGTLQYMSPEQAEMSAMDVDTRTDIYSLGVMLYEMLTGSTPIEKELLHNNALLQVLATIREADPPLPSVRLSSGGDKAKGICQSRKIAPIKLRQMLRGDLDWIVMKAIDKDRPRRYETANGLAMDIKRYLNGEPVTAAPPSAAYLIRKFIKRNRMGVIAASLVLAALFAGIVGTTWQSIKATGQRNRAIKAEEIARTEAAISKAVNDFLNKDLLAQASPSRQEDREIKLRTVLDLASNKIQGRFHQQPMVEASIRKTIADAYWALGVYEKSESHYRHRATILRRELGFDHPETLSCLYRLCMTLDRRNKFVEAEALQREILVIYDNHYPPHEIERLNVRNGLANSLWARGQLSDAIALYRETAKIARTAHPNHPRTVTFLLNEAWGVEYQGDYPEAEVLFSKTHELADRLADVEKSVVLTSTECLARSLWRQGKLEAAEKLYVGALDRFGPILGSEHPDIWATKIGLARVLNSQKKFVRAEQTSRAVLDVQPATIGSESFYTLISHRTLAWALLGQGHFDEAEQLFRNVLKTLENKNYGDDYLDVQDAKHGIAAALAGQGKYNEAEISYRELLEIQQTLFGSTHIDTVKTQKSMHKMLANQTAVSEHSDE